MTNNDTASMPIATFPCNKFLGLEYPYREDDSWGTTEKWNAQLAASNRMISASYGWAPNRAYKILAEAYRENLERDIQRDLRDDLDGEVHE